MVESSRPKNPGEEAVKCNLASKQTRRFKSKIERVSLSDGVADIAVSVSVSRRDWQVILENGTFSLLVGSINLIIILNY